MLLHEIGKGTTVSFVADHPVKSKRKKYVVKDIGFCRTSPSNLHIKHEHGTACAHRESEVEIS